MGNCPCCVKRSSFKRLTNQDNPDDMSISDDTGSIDIELGVRPNYLIEKNKRKIKTKDGHIPLATADDLDDDNNTSPSNPKEKIHSSYPSSHIDADLTITNPLDDDDSDISNSEEEKWDLQKNNQPISPKSLRHRPNILRKNFHEILETHAIEIFERHNSLKSKKKKNESLFSYCEKIFSNETMKKFFENKYDVTSVVELYGFFETKMDVLFLLKEKGKKDVIVGNVFLLKQGGLNSKVMNWMDGLHVIEEGNGFGIGLVRSLLIWVRDNVDFEFPIYLVCEREMKSYFVDLGWVSDDLEDEVFRVRQRGDVCCMKFDPMLLSATDRYLFSMWELK